MAEFYRKKKKICQMCAGKSVDYKDVEIIKKYVSADKGKILPRRITGACSKHQRHIASEVKNIGQNIRRVFSRTLNNGRDYYFMHRETGNVQTLILEGFFGDNKKDYEKFNTWEKQVTLCEAYVKGFCNHIGNKYVEPENEEIFYRVVTGSFKDIENAEKRADELKKKGFVSFIDIYKK